MTHYEFAMDTESPVVLRIEIDTTEKQVKTLCTSEVNQCLAKQESDVLNRLKDFWNDICRYEHGRCSWSVQAILDSIRENDEVLFQFLSRS